MAVISILQYPNPRLFQKASMVADVNDPDIRKIIQDMFDTLANTKNCAALAASQLDILNPPRILVINPILPYTKPFCLINPEIITKSEEKLLESEGCMSVYPENVTAKVSRAKAITLKALDVFGNEIIIPAENFLARCFQHEIDHLNGILYIDLLSKIKKDRLLAKLEKTVQRY